jgi:NADPH:quinone reductase-like Zn-dependent oxidoreductase
LTAERYRATRQRQEEPVVKAMVQDRYGSPDVLKLEEVPSPVPGPGEVLLRVRAAAVDPGEWALLTGEPYIIRVMGFGLRRPKLRVRGTDVAGRVEAVGEDVSDLRPGDDVFGLSTGSFAEYTSVRADKVVIKPPNLSFEQAGAVPSSGLTALQVLRDYVRVRTGMRVLVIGAAGGVGSFAVQIGKALGAEVVGVASTSGLNLVRSLGADDVIDYTRTDFADRRGGYEAILDTAGNRSLSHLRRALTPNGTLVIIGGRGGRLLGGTDRNLRALMLSPFVRQTLRAPFLDHLKGHNDDLLALVELIEAGKVTPVIDSTYSLEDVPKAMWHLRRGHAHGKVVISV